MTQIGCNRSVKSTMRQANYYHSHNGYQISYAEIGNKSF